MRDDVIHLLVGYDPATDRIAYREEIPGFANNEVFSIVGPDPDDPDAISSYPVDLTLARDIMGVAQLRIGDARLEYFLESRGTAVPSDQNVAAGNR